MQKQSFLFLLFVVLATLPLVNASAETAWIRKGPQIVKPKSSEVSATENSIKSSNDKGTNTINWTTPPAVLREGDTVKLTMDATMTEGPLMTGTWYIEDCTNSENVINFNNGVGSFAGYKRESPNHSDMVFKFKPRFTPTISVGAGRYDDHWGNMQVKATWTYEEGEAPASSPSAETSPSSEETPATVTVELVNVPSKLKPGDTITGKMRVTLSNTGTKPRSLFIAPMLTDYSAMNAAQDFVTNDMKNFLQNKTGTQFDARVKVKSPSNKQLNDQGDGVHEFDLMNEFPMTIPQDLPEGQYMLIGTAMIVGQKELATARTGIDIEKNPLRIQLLRPAVITESETTRGVFRLKLAYVLSGLKDGTREEVQGYNMRVRSNITGPDPFGVPELPLDLVPHWRGQGAMPTTANGEIEFTAQRKFTEPGIYVWHYTLYGSGGVTPYTGEISFAVSPQHTPVDAPVPIPEGMARVSGIGDDAAIEISTQRGWVNVKNGNFMPLALNGIPTAVRTQVRVTIELPSGRKLILKPGTEILFTGGEDGTLQRGGIKIYGNAEDRKKGWTVKTHNMSAKEDGTIFSVTYDEPRQVSVIEVEEGQVTVTPNNPNFPPVTLHAGDRLEVSADKVGNITTAEGSFETGTSAQGGTPFERRIRDLFNSTKYPDNFAFDAFASISIVIARLNLPSSCYSNDPYVNERTWEAHRKWSAQSGRQRSADNIIWKTGGALACLSDQTQKDQLISEIEKILSEAEKGSVVRLPDVGSESKPLAPPAPPAADGSSAISGASGPINVTGASYGLNCGAPAGNATQHAQQTCNGKTSCDYVVDVLILGDPTYGCAKDYRISWRCGSSSSQLHTVTVGSEAGWPPHTAKISCPPPQEAVTSIT